MQFINLCLIHVSTMIINMFMENRQGHNFHIKNMQERIHKVKASTLTNVNIHKGNRYTIQVRIVNRNEHILTKHG